MTPAIKSSVQERFLRVRAFSATRASSPARLAEPDWIRSPMRPDRVSYEIAQWADPNAVIRPQRWIARHLAQLEFNPLTGRDLSSITVGTRVRCRHAAGVKLARPNRRSCAWSATARSRLGPTGALEHGALELRSSSSSTNNHATGVRTIGALAGRRRPNETRLATSSNSYLASRTWTCRHREGLAWPGKRYERRWS